MVLRFMVEIEVKNDGATQELGQRDLALMLMNVLEHDKGLDAIPWVIARHYSLVKD